MNNSVLTTLKHEVQKVIPPTIFFFIALHVIALVRKLLTEGTGLTTTTSLQIAIAALILGKAVLIADILPMINRFPEKPLAYNVGWKTLIYYVIATVIHYAERLYDAVKETHSLAAANEQLLTTMVWAHFWGIQIIVLVVVFNYSMIRELGRALGEDRVFRLFFLHRLPNLRA